MTENKFRRTCYENNEEPCFNSLCERECYMKRVQEGVKKGFIICPITDLNCWDKICVDSKCNLERNPFNHSPEGRNEYWQVINKQLDIIHQLTKERDILLSINQKQTQIMASIEEVQAAVLALQASVDQKQDAIAAAIKALEDQVAAGGAATPDQLQGVIDSLKAVQSDVDSTPTA